MPSALIKTGRPVQTRSTSPGLPAPQRRPGALARCSSGKSGGPVHLLRDGLSAANHCDSLISLTALPSSSTGADGETTSHQGTQTAADPTVGLHDGCRRSPQLPRQPGRPQRVNYPLPDHQAAWEDPADQNPEQMRTNTRQ